VACSLNTIVEAIDQCKKSIGSTHATKRPVFRQASLEFELTAILRDWSACSQRVQMSANTVGAVLERSSR
jgi:hypothetical protein